jgi:hypothetical protein
MVGQHQPKNPVGLDVTVHAVHTITGIKIEEGQAGYDKRMGKGKPDMIKDWGRACRI